MFSGVVVEKSFDFRFWWLHCHQQITLGGTTDNFAGDAKDNFLGGGAKDNFLVVSRIILF